MSFYPKSLTLGQRYVTPADILVAGDYEITEKVDGSQFSFYWKEDGTLVCRSKKGSIDLNTTNKMFSSAVGYLKSLPSELTATFVGYEFFGESIFRPRHNVLEYARTPRS